MYRTRNKIVHKGDIIGTTDEKSLLKLDEGGAKASIECAYHIFQWFGINDKYPSLNQDRIKVKVPKPDE